MKNRKVIAYLNLTSDFIHNILDGIALGIVFSTNEGGVAWATVAAVASHEIPQEIGDVGILLHGGLSIK